MAQVLLESICLRIMSDKFPSNVCIPMMSILEDLLIFGIFSLTFHSPRLTSFLISRDQIKLSRLLGPPGRTYDGGGTVPEGVDPDLEVAGRRHLLRSSEIR